MSETATDKATARPWEVSEPIEENSSGYIIQSADGSGSICTMNGRAWYGENEPRAIENKANATLIIKAVNEHDALRVVEEEAEKIPYANRTDSLHQALSTLAQLRKGKG